MRKYLLFINIIMPMHHHRHRALKLILVSLVFSLWGCTTTDQISSSTNSPDETTIVSDPFVDQQLLAVEALLSQSQIDEAQAIIGSLEYPRLSIAQKTKYVLLQSDIALTIGDGQAAITWLSQEYAYLLDGLPLEQQIRISQSRALAYELTGQPLAAAKERIYANPVLEFEQQKSNQEQIWFDLQIAPEEELKQLAEIESSPDLNGWLELSLISLANSEDLNELLKAVEKWQKTNPYHPAAKQLPGSLQMLRELALSQPTQVAVLLPLSGQLEKAGDAIRNGLLSAWYQAKLQGTEVPKLKFYDTTRYEDAGQLYALAIQDGAQAVIGPLSKSKVKMLSESEDLSVPLLALNYTDTKTLAKPNFYQFGLAPEDEAIQVADDIWQKGARNVMVISPSSQWGDRVSDAFIKHWQLKGGIISSKARFDRPDQYLGNIKNALNIQNSEKRHALLQSKLSENLEFEFRRRQDIDMVFMLAFPAQARQLKPILNYQRATDLPVVATSSINSGKNNTDKDKDLDGIQFVEMPWRLSPSIQKQTVSNAFPDSMENYASLVALGVDAYKLHARLPQMSVFGDVRVQGETGTMTMTKTGRIKRELDWAIVKKGQIQPLVSLDPAMQ